MKLNDILKHMLTWGTPACGLFCGIIGVIVAVLIMTVGFWRMMLIALLAVIGAFIGGVKDKPAFIKNTINRLFPPKDDFDD